MRLPPRPGAADPKGEAVLQEGGLPPISPGRRLIPDRDGSRFCLKRPEMNRRPGRAVYRRQAGGRFKTGIDRTASLPRARNSRTACFFQDL